MKPTQHRQVRYRILKALQVSHPTPLDEPNIYMMIHPRFSLFTEEDIVSEIVYLREAGYLTSKKIKSELDGEFWLHRISKRGIDLLQGSIDRDPAIDIPVTELG